MRTIFQKVEYLVESVGNLMGAIDSAQINPNDVANKLAAVRQNIEALREHEMVAIKRALRPELRHSLDSVLRREQGRIGADIVDYLQSLVGPASVERPVIHAARRRFEQDVASDADAQALAEALREAGLDDYAPALGAPRKLLKG